MPDDGRKGAQTGARTLTIDDLEAPSTARARGLAAGAAALRMQTGLCGDRGRAAATATVDAFLRAARP